MPFALTIVIFTLVFFFALFALAIIRFFVKAKRNNQTVSQRRAAANDQRNATAIQRNRSSPSYERVSTTEATSMAENRETSFQEPPPTDYDHLSITMPPPTDYDHLSITMPPPAYNDHTHDTRLQ
ncbi:hypothetical protein K492DRAFT_170659 [Lichtheimia hyalospora FSU 10163]|nr:hypothetical protein K492DRAFT_170659 [Lichtheimia hyalospora FSU 10163]